MKQAQEFPELNNKWQSYQRIQKQKEREMLEKDDVTAQEKEEKIKTRECDLQTQLEGH